MRTTFYDLAASPVTWEFLNSALLAKADGYDRLVIVPGQRAPGITHYSEEVAQRRVKTMMVPLAEALGLEVVVAQSRERAKLYYDVVTAPRGYSVDNPGTNHYLKIIAARMPLGIEFSVSKAVEARYQAYAGSIVITVREQTFQPLRNSNIAAWIEAADQLREKGFRVVFVPDYDRQETRFGQHEICHEVVTNMAARIALAKVALVNMYIPNGPCGISFMTSLPCILMKLVVADYHNSEAKIWNKAGIETGGQPHWFGSHQRFVWKDDTAGNIVHAVEDWCAANPERVREAVA